MHHSARVFVIFGICRRLIPRSLLLAGMLLAARPFASTAEAPVATLTIPAIFFCVVSEADSDLSLPEVSDWPRSPAALRRSKIRSDQLG